MLGSTSRSILFYGVLGPKIWYARGLRLGDALSPMLFIIVMDALSLIFDKAENLGILTPMLQGNPIPQ
jgi:hypothetical protein